MHNCACTIFLIVPLKIEFPLPSLPSFHGQRSCALGGYEASMGQFDHNLGGITETINGWSTLKYCQVQEFYFHNHSWTQTYTYFYTVDIPHRSPPTNPLTTRSEWAMKSGLTYSQPDITLNPSRSLDIRRSAVRASCQNMANMHAL